MQQYPLNTIDQAIADFSQGRFLIVVDDANRENEGDFVIAAQHITPDNVNFMMRYGRGLLCTAITAERCRQLELPMQTAHNSSAYDTPFTITVDKIGGGCTTGVSTYDRAQTIQALANPHTLPQHLARPGHTSPLRAQDQGVLARPGHTEATVDLARLAGLYPAGALIEILNDDGTMARLPQLIEIAQRFDIKIISIADLVTYRLQHNT